MGKIKLDIMGTNMKKLLLAVLCLQFTLTGLWAGPLKMLNVSTPQFNCLFDTNCVLHSVDTTSTIHFNGATGLPGLLTTRTWEGAIGTTLGGKFAYGYHIDLARVMEANTNSYIDTLKVNATSLVPFTFAGSVSNMVWVITNSAGTVAPSSAMLIGPSLIFRFVPPLHVATPGVKGQATLFFGVVSSMPSTNSLATITGAQAGNPPMPLNTNLWARSSRF